MISNPIARITAAIIVILTLLAVTGVIGEVNADGEKILTLMLGSALTFLFVAQTRAASNTG